MSRKRRGNAVALGFRRRREGEEQRFAGRGGRLMTSAKMLLTVWPTIPTTKTNCLAVQARKANPIDRRRLAQVSLPERRGWFGSLFRHFTSNLSSPSILERTGTTLPFGKPFSDHHKQDTSFYLAFLCLSRGGDVVPFSVSHRIASHRLASPRLHPIPTHLSRAHQV